MSQENVETLRRAMEAFNRRDTEAFSALLVDDAEILPARAALEGIVYRGPNAAFQYCRAVDERWSDLRWEIEGFRDAEDVVLAHGHIRGHGRDSGAELDARAGWVGRFRGALIENFQTHRDREQALEAAGLSE